MDVAVVGGGITGMTAALLLAEAGRKVALLEARTLVSGVTGCTTAHVTEAVDTRYHEIRSKFGREGARLVAESSRAAIDHIVDRVARLSIACDLRRVPGYLFSETADDRDELEEEHRAAHEAGVGVDLGVPISLPFRVAGVLRFRDQLRFHPRAYVLGLAHAARASGCAIFEDTRVVELHDGEPVVMRTDAGAQVRAGAAFCATHVPLNRLLLHTKLVHLQSYVAAFKDVSIADGLYWDMADPYHYLRGATVDGHAYLVVGGEDHKLGEEEHTQVHFERLLGYTRARFGTDRPTFHWSAQVVEPIDGLPYLGLNSASRHVYVATGFSGNGMTFGTIAALLASDLIRGVHNPWAELYDATRVTPSSLGTFLTENASVPVHLIGERLQAPEVTAPHEILRDQGRTMKVDGVRLAVYRDRGGRLHSVSGVCTHMGCLVRFNEAERTWDCPCHGSRFDVDGHVLDGPALTDLAPHPIEDEPEPRPIDVYPSGPQS